MKIDFSKTAVIVVDMQKDFYGDGGNATQRGKPVKNMQALPAKIMRFVNKLRSKGSTIVFTKFIYDPVKSPNNYIDMIKDTKNSNWICEAGSEGAELNGVRPKEEDIVIEKHSYDAFAGTDLKNILARHNINTVVICGVRSEVCINATVNGAFARGYKIIVIEDLIGSFDDKSSLTKSILDSLKYSAYIMNSSDFKTIK